MARGGHQGARVHLTSNQNISTSSWVTVSWEAEAFDDLGFWASSPNPTRIIIPSDVDRILLIANLQFEVDASTSSMARMIKNGNVFDGHPTTAVHDLSTSHRARHNLKSGLLTVAESDYFELQIWQNKGSDYVLEASDRTWFAVQVMV